MTTCWKCADSDAAYQAKCTAPACGMRETAEPRTNPENYDAVENVRLDAELQRCMKERDVLRTELAALRAAPSVSPVSQADAEALAHRIATTYTHRSAPGYSSYAFMPHTLMDFVRAIEAAHGIALPPPAK